MDKITRIRHEIERRKNYISVTHFVEELLAFLDTLSEEPDKSVEKAADDYIGEVVDTAGHPGWDWETHDIIEAFIAGAKWEADHLRDSTKMVDESLEEAAEKSSAQYYKDAGYSPFPNVETAAHKSGFIAGAKWQKSQMLKDAVEGYVNYYEDGGGILMAEAQVGCPYHNGDKVRIVILKAEED